jgi:hypothetical protein
VLTLTTIIATATRIVAETCGVCGVQFGLTDSFQRARMEDGESFHCPNGHRIGYSNRNEVQRLRDEVARQKHATEQAQANASFWKGATDRANEREQITARSLRATKAVVTRTKKKIVAGRCPCCSHQFKNLRDHMAKEHPKYDPDKAAAAIESKVTP